MNEQVVDQLIKNIEQELDQGVVVDNPVPLAPLPEAVQRFSETISNKFEGTARSLEATAAKLEQAAADLRSKADRLRTASPQVRSTLEDWIRFEQSSYERQRFLGSIFEPEKKEHPARSLFTRR